ncbi:MAG TPA: hypothetical protein VG847_05780 [Chitinophagaceae bacterium]|nr:hypothetical protein [Chitinophagaceae bacterium]
MIFNGWRGWHYTMQRTIVEMLISLRLTEEKINKKEREGEAVAVNDKP